MRVCKRCRKETDKMFCPDCRVLTFPTSSGDTLPESAPGDSFECTVWQGPNRTRGIEVSTSDRDRYFSRRSEEVVLHFDGRRTVAKLSQGFWRKPAVIKKARGDSGRDELIKFFEKHHLLPPDQSLKEKGVVDTLVFEVVVPGEEFKVTIIEKQESDDYSGD